MPPLPRLLFAALFLLCLHLPVQGQVLRIVSEAWPPYIHEEQGVLRGLDYEAATVVLQRLGIEATWQLLPWKRCLLALEQGQADAILDIFHTPERDATILFPSEPMSRIELVLFYNKAHPYPFKTLDDLQGLKIGVSAGYWYANRQFRESPLFTREPAPSHEASFGKLLRNRVDMLVNDRLSGRYLLAQMGLEQQLDHHPTVISRDSLYLGIRRNAGLDDLAERFAQELKRFKREPAYATLLERYATTAPKAAAPATLR